MSGFTLAIDTSAGTSVALLDGEQVLAEQTVADAMRHAEVIGDAIVEVLRQVNASARQVSAVVVGRGPAPFTGLRVGLAAAKMFAAGARVPVFGVVSHDAIAYGILNSPDAPRVSAESPLLVATDARRKEVYFALYSGRDQYGAPIRIGEPGVMKEAALLDQLSGQGRSPVRVERTISASVVGQVFSRQLLNGSETKDVTALYLRAPDAIPSPGKKVSG